MATILSYGVQKGGTGKTTSVLNTGMELTRLGKKVLLVDIDPQYNLTSSLGIDPTELEYSVYEVLHNSEQGAGFAIYKTSYNGLDIIPSTLALAGAEAELHAQPGRELLLREALESVENQYDYILIDTPPSLGVFTANAYVASNAGVIVPLQAQYLALQGIDQLQEFIKLLRRLNKQIKISGVLVTMCNNTRLSKAVIEEVNAKFGNLVFKTCIPVNTRLGEAPAAGQPISVYDARSVGAEAYKELAKELIERYG